jgi:hypothetical protein
MGKQIKIFIFPAKKNHKKMEKEINKWLEEKGESIAIVHSQITETVKRFILSCIFHEKSQEKQNDKPKQVKIFRSEPNGDDLENLVNEWFDEFGDENIEVSRCLQSANSRHLTMLIFFRSSRNKSS